MYSNSNLNAYFRSYCWIHGTAYIREHLQGKATGCFVDQSRIESEEDAPVSLSMMYMMVDMKGLVLEKMDRIFFWDICLLILFDKMYKKLLFQLFKHSESRLTLLTSR